MKRFLILLLLCRVCFGDIFTSHMKPNADDTLDLGTSSLQWNHVYAVNATFTGTITDGLWNGDKIDISDFTNLAVSAPVTLTGDTVGFDSTLLSATTWGSGSNFTWTFDTTTGDPTIRFTDVITLSSTLMGGNLDMGGNDITNVAGITMIGNLDMGGNDITNVAGITMIGNLDMGGNDITGVDDITMADDSVIKSAFVSLTFDDTAQSLALTNSQDINVLFIFDAEEVTPGTFTYRSGVGATLTWDKRFTVTDVFKIDNAAGVTATITMDGTSNTPGLLTYNSDNEIFTVDKELIVADTNFRIGDGTAATVSLHFETTGLDGEFTYTAATDILSFNKALTVTGTGTFGDIGIGINAPDQSLEIRDAIPVIRLRDTGATASATNAFIEFGGTDAGIWSRTGWVGDGSSGNTTISLWAEVGDLQLGDSSSMSVVTLSGGDATFTGTINIGDSGKITFRDTDISIGSTLTDGILDINADFSIDMFFDNADRGAEVDGQSLNINRRAVEGDDYISLFVDKDQKGLIGFSGDDDLLSLASGILTVNGDIFLGATNAIVFAEFSPGVLQDRMFSSTLGVMVQENASFFSIYCDINDNNNATDDMLMVLEGDTQAGGTANLLMSVKKNGLMTVPGSTALGDNDADTHDLHGATTIINGGELRFSDVGDSHYVGFTAPALTATQIWTLPTADGDPGAVFTTDGAGVISWTDNASEKTWAFMSRDASSGTNYIGGFYDFGGDEDLTNAGATATHGTANLSYAAHAIAVSSGAGVTNGSDLVLTVSGTSITDAGTRTDPDSEVIIADCTAESINDYSETVKKWIGTITYTLSSTGGGAFNHSFNSGYAKYWDNNNTAFKVVGIEATWLGAKNDANPDIELRHHKTTGWTYNNGADATPPAAIASMATDHDTEIQIGAAEEGAWKRDNLSTNIDGGNSEGTIIELTTTTNRTYAIGNFLVRITPQ